MKQEHFQYYQQVLTERLGYECRIGHIAEKHSEGESFVYIIVEKNIPSINRISFRIENQGSEFLDNEIIVCHFNNGETYEYGYDESDDKELIIRGYAATERKAWENAVNLYQ